LWKITTVSTDKDTLTWETPYSSADFSFNTGYSCKFVTNASGDLFLFVGQYAPSSGSLIAVVYKYSGGSWSKDLTIFNNGSNPSSFEQNTSGAIWIANYGNDVYIGPEGLPGSTNYQSLYHLRWNGSYFAAQTDPEWPHATDAPPVAVQCLGIEVTPDGGSVIAIGSNAGANDIPNILAYDRDADTGALTLRDTTWDFWDKNDANPGLTYSPDGNGDWVNTNYRFPQARASRPTDAF
jgi:hypothetical protein